jgi:hypothetical protein
MTGPNSERAIKIILAFVAVMMGVVISLVSYGIVSAPPVAPSMAAHVPNERVLNSEPRGQVEPTATAPTHAMAAPPLIAPVPMEPAPPASAAPMAAVEPTPAAAPPAPAANPQLLAEVTTAATAPAGRLTRVAIRGAQRDLARLGYDPGFIDGSLGRGTRNAIRAYQAARGLLQTGELTPTLADLLAQDSR